MIRQPPSTTPLILFTGFLGSGKTTWLRHGLSCGLHRPCGLGVVMNDFGPVSVDSLLVAQPDLPLEQIGGGCICCSDEQSLDPAEVVRAKGFVRLRGCGRQLFGFHSVQGRQVVEPHDGTARPKPVAVFIGPRLHPDKHLEQLEAVFDPATTAAPRSRKLRAR